MTVLDVHPVGYDTAARVLADDVAAGVEAAVEVLLAALRPCYGMAGTDDTAQKWAPGYDAAARATVTGCHDLVTAGYRLAALLEQCAINYAGAEAACLPGQTGTRSAGHWADQATRHQHLHPDPPPPAAGLTLPEPEGWSLLAHLIGRVWPNGHQDLLHTAAEAWHSAATTLQNLGPVLDRATARLADEQDAPEIADAVTVVCRYGIAVAQLALHCRDLADTCTALATGIDRAHSAIGHECLTFLNTTIAAEAAGGLLAVATAGLAEAAAQAVVARAGYTAATAIRATIDTLSTLVTGIAADLDTTTTQLAALSRDLHPTLARTTVQATVTRPGVAGVLDRQLPDVTAIIRLDQYERRGPGLDIAAETWGNMRTLLRHFQDHGADFGSNSMADYAHTAELFRLRAIGAGLPCKLDGESVLIYDPATNTFGVYRLDGKARTIFKPDDGIDYWNTQRGTLTDGRHLHLSGVWIHRPR